jgi:hypothetical protein
VGYKIEVWGYLSAEEKKAIRELKSEPPQVQAPPDYDPDKIPLIKEKSTYWSKSKACKVTIFITLPAVRNRQLIRLQSVTE